jgi:hypothetical protein
MSPAHILECRLRHRLQCLDSCERVIAAKEGMTAKHIDRHSHSTSRPTSPVNSRIAAMQTAPNSSIGPNCEELRDYPHDVLKEYRDIFRLSVALERLDGSLLVCAVGDPCEGGFPMAFALPIVRSTDRTKVDSSGRPE